MNTYKHSGTTGDLIYSLPLVKYSGGGEFYLHLDQMVWLTQRFYGWDGDPHHRGRMNMSDFNFLKSFMEAQPYISKFDILDVKTTAITHNLDRFRPMFAVWPRPYYNYVDVYSATFGIDDPEVMKNMRQTAWLTVPNTRTYPGRDIVINRSLRYTPTILADNWNRWKMQGFEDRAFFVGLPNEYESFKKIVGWNIPYQPTSTLLEVAEFIKGSSIFIGNQSMALSIAIGAGAKEVWCETPRTTPLENNECYFPNQNGVNYF